MLRVHNPSLRSRIWIIQWEVYLKLDNSSLEQALFDKVHAMPSCQRGVYLSLNRVALNDLSRRLLDMRGCRKDKHAHDWVLLQEFEIKLQNLVSRLEPLVHFLVFLKVRLLPMSVQVLLFFLLEVAHELLKGFWDFFFLFLHLVDLVEILCLFHFVC